MKRVQLSGTDLQVSPVCLGTWQFNNGEQSADKTWPAQSIEVSRSIADAAIENGINFFDTAQAYLNSEEVVGKVLEGRRKNVIVATKMGQGGKRSFSPQNIEEAITQSLTRLKTDYIDLYQVHWPHFIADDVKGCVAELNRQQAKGRIRYYGVCNFGPKNLEEFMAAGGKPVTNQLAYSLLWRPIEYEVMPMCKSNNIDILAYSPLQQGLLSGKYRCIDDIPEGRRRTRLFNSSGTSLCKHGEDGAEKQMFQAINDVASACDTAGLSMPSTCLSWCLNQAPVQSVIAGASSPQQVLKNAQLVDLQQDMLQQLTAITKELKETFGNSPDLWSHESRIA